MMQKVLRIQHFFLTGHLQSYKLATIKDLPVSTIAWMTNLQYRQILISFDRQSPGAEWHC